MDTLRRLILPRQFWEQMLHHVRQAAPEEACGLVVGKIENHPLEHGQAYGCAVIPLTNLLHSPVKYRASPQEQLDAFNWIDVQGWELVGIYHSHPVGPQEPSPTDIAEAYYPDVIYLIWSSLVDTWSYRGFLIKGEKVMEVAIDVVGQGGAAQPSSDLCVI